MLSAFSNGEPGSEFGGVLTSFADKNTVVESDAQVFTIFPPEEGRLDFANFPPVLQAQEGKDHSRLIGSRHVRYYFNRYVKCTLWAE